MRFHRSFHKRGLTLVELMVTILVFLPAILSTILVFFRCVALIELSQNMSLAVSESQNRLMLIETTPFAQIAATYHQQPFFSQTLNGRGVTYVQTVDTNLLQVTVSLSWIEDNGRTIGEDSDFDGTMDSGEDVNGNGILDSPVELVTMIYNL